MWIRCWGCSLWYPKKIPERFALSVVTCHLSSTRCCQGREMGRKDCSVVSPNTLTNHHQLQTCVECPALLRGPRGVMLLHWDDVLMVCGDEWLTKTFLRDRKTKFKVSLQVARKSGESVNFLKRQYVMVGEGISVVHSHRHVETLIEKFEKCNDGRRPRVSKTPYYPALFPETGVGELLEE